MLKNKEVISGNQAFAMVALFVIGSATLMFMGLSAKLDVWIAILVALVVASLIMCMYSRLLSILPEKDLFETLETLLGKPLTIIFVLLLAWFSFDLGQIVLTNYTQFMTIIGLSETPFVIISLSMALLCAFSIKFGLEVIGRWAQLFIIPVVGFLLIALIAADGHVNIKNLQPILYEGFTPVLKGAQGVIAFPFAETVVFLLVFPAFKKTVSPYKVFLRGLYVAGVFLLALAIVGISAFGAAYSSILAYPFYEVLSIFKIGTFINRMEILGAAFFCVGIFLKITILLCGACKGFAYTFKINDYRILAFPLALMMVNFNLFSFQSLTSFQDWTAEVFTVYAPVFEIVIPFIIFIMVEIRYRQYKKAIKANPNPQ